MTEKEFRRKYPGSTDEQVRLYCKAVRAEKRQAKPAVEPDILMPLITVPEPVVPTVTQATASEVITTYTVPANRFQIKNFSLDDVPPEVPSASIADELRDILLGTYGFKSALSSEQRQRLLTEDLTEDEMLALVVGAPSAREFRDLSVG